MAFSITRTREYALYMWPELRRQIYLFSGISLILGLFMLLPFPTAIRIGIYGVVGSACTLIYNLSPLVFAWGGDYRPVDAMLPVSAIEKFLFYMVYLLVVLPVIIFLFPEIAEALCRNMYGIVDEDFMQLFNLKLENPYLVRWVNLLSKVAVTLTCFYYVMRSGRNRILKGILAAIIANIAVVILGVMWGAGRMFKAGFDAGISGKPDISAEELSELINSTAEGSLIFALILLTVYLIMLLWLIYKIIRYPAHD